MVKTTFSKAQKLELSTKIRLVLLEVLAPSLEREFPNRRIYLRLLSLLRRLNCLIRQSFWVETNCFLVVKVFSNSNLDPWKIRSRWLRCQKYILSIDFMVTHIYREANFYADILASIGYYNRNFDWFNHVHLDILKDYLLGILRLRLCY